MTHSSTYLIKNVLIYMYSYRQFKFNENILKTGLYMPTTFILIGVFIYLNLRANVPSSNTIY